MLSETVVERYARALYEVAAENGEVIELGRHLSGLSRFYGENELLRDALHNPAIPAEPKMQVLQALIGAEAPAALQAFVQLLVVNNRAEILAQIGPAYERLHDRARGIRRAQVTTARPLTSEQTRRLTENLANLFAAPVELTAKVEPETIGGICVRVDDLLIDGSVQGRLKRLRDQFARVRDTAY